MKDKKIYLAILVFLIVVLLFLMYYSSTITFVSILLMPILFCISKLAERLGVSFYHSSFEKDVLGLIVFMLVLVILLVYDWNKFVYWFLIGTASTFLVVLICRKMYKTKK